jgi:Tol biopolymer transport system component
VTLPHGPGAFPSVSPDGSKLLYATFMSTDGGSDSALYLYDFASRSSTLVVTTTELTYSALSPDGRTVAWTTSYSLHAVDADGTNDRTLLAGPNAEGTGYGHPVFASDSTTVVYGTGGIIGAIRIDGSQNETLLTAIPGSFQYPNPAFSPDYQQIVVGAFCDQASPEALRIYAYASLPGATCSSGQFLVDVSAGSSPNQANDPSWSQDGRIAYGSGKDVLVIDATGGVPVNLTADLTGDAGTATASDPVWAPACADVP